MWRTTNSKVVVCTTLVVVTLLVFLIIFFMKRQREIIFPAPMFFLIIQTSCPQNYNIDYDWILHHLRLGADHFFIYQNDNAIQKQEEPYDHFITFVPTYSNSSLEDNFKDCILKFGKLSVWIASVEVDEFIVANDGLPINFSEAHKNDQSDRTMVSVQYQRQDDYYHKYILRLDAFFDKRDFAFLNFNTKTYSVGEAETIARRRTSSLQNNPSTRPSSSLKGHLTIVITTAPSLCNGSLRIIRSTLESLKSYSTLRGVHLIVGFDGVHVIAAPPVHEKCSTAYSEHVYNIYKKSVKAYVSLLFDSYEFVELEHRSCLTTLLRTSMDKVQTRYVLIMQDDLSLVGNDKIDFESLIKAMEAYPDEFGIINLRTWPSNAFHIKWENETCDKNVMEKIPLRKFRFGNLELSSSRCYSDQVQISTKDFYDRYVWSVVPDFDFMEHYLQCGRLHPTNQIWNLGSDSDFYAVHHDTRKTCSSRS